jgi:hypothetical protein
MDGVVGVYNSDEPGSLTLQDKIPMSAYLGCRFARTDVFAQQAADPYR